MRSEHWQKCIDTFNSVLDYAPNERATLLEQHCDGDEAVRRDVELLLKYHDQSGAFIESPAFEIAPQLFVGDADALLGRQFAHYRIESILGVGGMGVVYLAHDDRLGRKVALKLLPPALTADERQLQKLKQEARTTSALNHPNIVTIHEIGEIDGMHYIASEFIEGNTLRERMAQGRMAPDEALDIVIQLAGALAVAHAAGIVHRDIKPENIMLRHDGYVKILDFGIAKFIQPQSGHGTQTNTRFLILGTARYMSPEQARGVAVDSRTDIWSLGVVLYEMIAARPPFEGDTNTDVMAAVLRSAAPPLDRSTPATVQRIISRTLAKDPNARYQNAADLRNDLQRTQSKKEPFVRRFWPIAAAGFIVVVLVLFQMTRSSRVADVFDRSRTRPAAPDQSADKSIAVLPFQNLSEDPANAFFADGVQSEILTNLSKVADLKVISRTSVIAYRDTAGRNSRKIGQELGVAHLLEGSVQRAGNRVRVNAQLIDAQNDAQLWALSYDRDLADVFAIQSEIAKAIAGQLQAKLTGPERQSIASKPTDNLEAYDAYLRGLAYSQKTARSSGNDAAAQKSLRDAVQLDPKFAQAWALLSYVDATGYLSLSLQPTEALREESRQAAETALSLQPNLGEALQAQGYYHYACLKDYDTAERYFEKARQFLPNGSSISESVAFLSRRRGRWDRSESAFNEAERLDPRNPRLLTQHALSYIALRRFPEALRKIDQILDIIPDDTYSEALKAGIAQLEGDLPRAAALLAPLHPGADQTEVLEAQAYQAVLERRPAEIIARLKELLAKADPALGYNVGGLRFYLGWAQDVSGDRDGAMESWRQARSELEAILKEQPENYLLIGALAFTDMGLGDKTAALNLIENAMARNPTEQDAVFGLRPLEIFARVAATAGESDRAIEAIEKLLRTPYGGVMRRLLPLTPALLRLDPMFDP
ncbi:MAG: protein kinase, partial [Chthoniobacterales bacterium]